MYRNFREILNARWNDGKFVCVRLDSDHQRIPSSARMMTPDKSIVIFNRAIIKTTKEHVCAYKLNPAFYLKHGAAGIDALCETIADINEIAPHIPTILDANYGDTLDTNEFYAATAFDYFKADAVTVNPYFGGESLMPFFERSEKGIFVLCRTSNPHAGEFQDFVVDGRPFYQRVAYDFATYWNANRNCMLVVAAAFSNKLREVRQMVGDMPILILGIGAQEGDLEKAVKAGMDSNRLGFIVDDGSSAIYASNNADYADAAGRETLRLHDLITQYRT